MGHIYADLELVNSFDLELFLEGRLAEDNVRKVNVRAMVDTGAWTLAINEEIQKQLNLRVKRKSPATLADGSIMDLEVVGPVEVRFQNRETTVDAVVLPGNSEVLLGAIPLEGMDVLIDPRNEQLIVNPAHPNRAQFKLK